MALVPVVGIIAVIRSIKHALKLSYLIRGTEKVALLQTKSLKDSIALARYYGNEFVKGKEE